jgi:hypothetical protein
MEVDLSKLKPVLAKAVRQSFDHLRELRRGGRIYAFALFTAGEVNYLLPTANSEAGLSQKAEEYLKKDGVGSMELQRTMLRWSPADWAHHLEGEGYFKGVNELLGQRKNYLADDYVPESEAILELCTRVLREADGDGIFGTGKEREGLTLNLLMGDQSDEERVRYARQLNSRAVAGRCKREVEAGTAAFFKWSKLKAAKKK